MLKIILADNQAIFRAGAAKVLAVEDDLRIVAQCEDRTKTTAAIEKFQASVLLYSSSMLPDTQEVAQLCRANKAKPVVIAETTEDPQHFLNAGAAGVVFRSVSGTALVECVRKVAKGATWVQPTGQGDAATVAAENDAVGARVRDRLTNKELKIVALIVQGYKNKEIADRLGTTEQVIKNYLRNVYDKIGVSDRLELALFTIHHRILADAAAAVAAGQN